MIFILKEVESNDNEMYLFDHKNVHEILFISLTILVEETSIKFNK